MERKNNNVSPFFFFVHFEEKSICCRMHASLTVRCVRVFFFTLNLFSLVFPRSSRGKKTSPALRMLDNDKKMKNYLYERRKRKKCEGRKQIQRYNLLRLIMKVAVKESDLTKRIQNVERKKKSGQLKK